MTVTPPSSDPSSSDWSVGCTAGASSVSVGAGWVVVVLPAGGDGTVFAGGTAADEDVSVAGPDCAPCWFPAPAGLVAGWLFGAVDVVCVAAGVGVGVGVSLLEADGVGEDGMSDGVGVAIVGEYEGYVGVALAGGLALDCWPEPAPFIAQLIRINNPI